MRKKIVALMLASSIVCTAVVMHQKNVQASVLDRSDMITLELFSAIDSDNSSARELSGSLSEGNTAGSAAWLTEQIFDLSDAYGIEFSADEFSRKLEPCLHDLFSSGKIAVDGKNRLTELSKSYIVNSAVQTLSSLTDLSGEADQGSYSELTTDYVDLNVPLSQLEQTAEEKGAELPFVVTEQMKAMNTLALTLQFYPEGNKPDDSLYADKFYAINEIRTSLDALYHPAEEYKDIAEDISIAVNDIVQNTKDSVNENTADAASQMNEVQPLISEYVTQEVIKSGEKDESTAKKPTARPSDKNDTKAESDKSNQENHTGNAASDNNAADKTNPQLTLTEADIDFLTAMFDEKMSAMITEVSKSLYEQTLLMTTDEPTGSNNYSLAIAAEDLADVQQTVDGVADDVSTLQTRFNTLELRTRNDVLILGDEVDGHSNAIADMQSSLTTLQDRSKNDAGVIIKQQEEQYAETDTRLNTLEKQNVVTTIPHITINRSDDSGSGTLDTNANADSYVGKWVQQGSDYYIDIVNDAIIVDCDIDIKYTGEPNIVPEYTIDTATHTLRITVNNNAQTEIGVIYIYSKINV